METYDANELDALMKDILLEEDNLEDEDIWKAIFQDADAFPDAPAPKDIALFQKALLALNAVERLDEIRAKRKRKLHRDRNKVWQFVNSWDDKIFKLQYRVPKDEVCIRLRYTLLLIRLYIYIYDIFIVLTFFLPTMYISFFILEIRSGASGRENYQLALKRSDASTPNSGAITMEIKVIS